MNNNDRSIRYLNALEGASSNRVLNLIAIANANAENDKHRTHPLFLSRVLNRSLILKHRLRADEVDFFTTRRALVTKIIIPFERTDLKAGGHSFFVGQKSFQTLLQDVGNYKEITDMKRDEEVLKLIDSLPSLDPFLLREHLRCHDILPDSSYFAISPADQQRMHEYAAREVSRLTALANGGGGQHRAATGRMVEALLSNEVNEKLEPLRATLSMRPDEFAEGVFSWRGFIYYKWCLEEFWPNLIRALRGVKAVAPFGKVTSEERDIIESNRTIILMGARTNSLEIRRIIGIYDQAYSQMIDRCDPRLFKEFLLGAPELFLDIGDRMGAISHITSFWNYRFPQGAPRSAHAEELVTIFQDFTKGIATTMNMAA